MQNTSNALEGVDIFYMKVRGEGELLAFSAKQPRQCTANGRPINFEYDGSQKLRMNLSDHNSDIVVSF